MLESSAGASSFAGFVLFSGVFPNARIQQIAVAERHRRKGVGSALLREVISRHEAAGCLRITAAVADDLPASQAFYESNGFGAVMERPGGNARSRRIRIRARDLENEHLLSPIERPPGGESLMLDLGLRVRGAGIAPLYAIDLNVLFDAVREGRERALLAQRVVGAALAHRFRLATTAEFTAELERGAIPGTSDPTLALARQLPRLPGADGADESALADAIHRIVFGPDSTAEARRVQAGSDARHLAQAALARASGFLTSDGRMLGARARLMEEVGIDVISLDEFAALLDDAPPGSEQAATLAEADLARVNVPRNEAIEYLRRHGFGKALLDGLAGPAGQAIAFEAMFEAGEIVGLAARSRDPALDAPVKLLLHVRQDHVRASLLAEALVHSQCLQACADGPVVIEASDLSGQTASRRAAVLLGFVARRGGTMVKVAIGRPVTPRTWPAIARFTHRRTGLRLQEAPPLPGQNRFGVKVTGPDGADAVVALSALEDAVGPTLLAWPGRTGSIVPIARRYADDLLGTALQTSMFGPRQAALASRRIYVNSPRAASAMRPGTPILFYESVRSGGRGAIVAVARIVDSMIARKERLPTELMERSVIDDVDPLSATEEVLVTTFDNVLRCPVTVSIARLREMGAVGPHNLVTVTPVGSEALTALLDLGWPNG